MTPLSKTYKELGLNLLFLSRLKTGAVKKPTTRTVMAFGIAVNTTRTVKKLTARTVMATSGEPSVAPVMVR